MTLVDIIQITGPSDGVEVLGPDGELIVRLSVNPESGKYVVDDQATGRIFSDQP